MNDSFVTALNTQKTTVEWMNALTTNMTNMYTPGFKENKVNFKIYPIKKDIKPTIINETINNIIKYYNLDVEIEMPKGISI